MEIPSHYPERSETPRAEVTSVLQPELKGKEGKMEEGRNERKGERGENIERKERWREGQRQGNDQQDGISKERIMGRNACLPCLTSNATSSLSPAEISR